MTFFPILPASIPRKEKIENCRESAGSGPDFLKSLLAHCCDSIGFFHLGEASTSPLSSQWPQMMRVTFSPLAACRHHARHLARMLTIGLCNKAVRLLWTRGPECRLCGRSRMWGGCLVSAHTPLAVRLSFWFGNNKASLSPRFKVSHLCLGS